MRNGIKEFQPRQPLDRQLGAGTLNQILRELESLRITRVVNGAFRKLPGGTEIVVSQQRSSASSSTVHPFQIASSADPDQEGQYVVTVRPGTLNNLLPTNLFENNALRQFTISENELNYVVLTGQTNGSDQFISCSLSVTNSPPDAQEPTMFSLPTTAEFLLGVVYNASAYNTITDSLLVSGVQQFTEQKANPVAGALPYNIYYVWG